MSYTKSAIAFALINFIPSAVLQGCRHTDITSHHAKMSTRGTVGSASPGHEASETSMAGLERMTLTIVATLRL